jgi:TonB family protein
VVALAAPAPTPKPAPLADEIVDFGPGVVPPRRIAGEPARYPAQADRLRLQGTVAIEMIIEPTGEPTNLKIVASAGEILDKAALDAASTWRYEPATRNGAKVRYRHLFRQTFKRS